MSSRVRPVDGSRGLMFECPGCGENHGISVDGSRGWTWNGNFERPTITPSILAKGFRFIDDELEDTEAYVCHSFVTDGRIQFLGDCTHSKANQTVDLLEISGD